MPGWTIYRLVLSTGDVCEAFRVPNDRVSAVLDDLAEQALEHLDSQPRIAIVR